MSDKAREAWAIYQEAQNKAQGDYEEFWRQAFLSKGLAFQKIDYENVLKIKDWEITFLVYPRSFEGVRVTFQRTTGPWGSWRRMKIMSETGLQRFFKTLHNITQ